VIRCSEWLVQSKSLSNLLYLGSYFLFKSIKKPAKIAGLRIDERILFLKKLEIITRH